MNSLCHITILPTCWIWSTTHTNFRLWWEMVEKRREHNFDHIDILLAMILKFCTPSISFKISNGRQRDSKTFDFSHWYTVWLAGRIISEFLWNLRHCALHADWLASLCKSQPSFLPWQIPFLLWRKSAVNCALIWSFCKYLVCWENITSPDLVQTKSIIRMLTAITVQNPLPSLLFEYYSFYVKTLVPLCYREVIGQSKTIK